PDFGGESGWIHTADRAGTGATYRQGRRTGSHLVQLESGITRPEILLSLRSNPTFELSRKVLSDMGELVSSYDPAEESRMLAWVLKLVGLPLDPESMIGEVALVLDVFFPRLMWTKPLPA